MKLEINYDLKSSDLVLSVDDIKFTLLARSEPRLNFSQTAPDIVP